MDQRLSLVTLGVQDLPRARAFYESLGWKASAASCEQVCFFQTGSMALALYPHGVPAGGFRESGRRSGTGWNHPGDQRLPARGGGPGTGRRVGPGGHAPATRRDTPWGGRTAYFADPDGHPWEITWAPMFPLGPAGELRLP